MSNYLPTMRQKNFFFPIFFYIISFHLTEDCMVWLQYDEEKRFEIWSQIQLWWIDLLLVIIFLIRLSLYLYSTYKFSCLLGMHKISQMISMEYYKTVTIYDLIMFYAYYVLIYIKSGIKIASVTNISHCGGLYRLIISHFLLCLSLAAQNKKQ